MRRREFIAGLGSAAAVALPIRTRAQQSTKPVVGILHLVSSPDRDSPGVPALRKGLAEAGFDERNLIIEYRGSYDQSELPALAQELARRPVAAIVALGGGATALAAKGATATIPVVFAAPNDPVELGLVAALNRPGGNLTGVTGFTDEVAAKRMATLRELLPRATKVAFLTRLAVDDPANLLTKPVSRAAETLGLQLQYITAASESELEPAFKRLSDLHIDVVLADTSGPYVRWRHQIAALAARFNLPTIYAQRPFVEAGGLISYGTDYDEMYRQAGAYLGRILKGERPGDLPVLQPTKLELVINLKTARALGLTIPETLLATADEVIQ
jgi:putative ABC transport system substrate-binding protein